ncbi:PspC domain-containing protein [Agromyces sp. GXS1127]|uniref:PspC domain-containing protein n=1 Tax=Agromyces sp. GXS1127 TaxID=3424181 RepID=UPI003D320F61
METNQTAPPTDPAPDGVQGDSAQAGPSAAGAVGSAPGDRSSGVGAPAGPDHDTAGPGFYAWLRRLGLPRHAGWLGGVCAGVGTRLGIDPVIVRGIVAVVALLGAPFVLLYAIAWLLLPDTEGRIHLERLTRGIVDPAVVGIAVMAVLGFIPLIQGGWFGWRMWDDSEFLAVPMFGFDLSVPLRVTWTVLVVGGVVALVVWLAKRASQNPPTGGDTRISRAEAASAVMTDGSSAPPADAEPVADPGAAPATSDTAPTTEPPAPAAGPDAAAVAEWREQHEAWRIAHAEWKTGQDQAMRAAKAQAAAENREKARAFAAQAEAARAARRRSRPRASAAFVFTMLGLALVIGAAVALWALGGPDVGAFTVPVALAAATLVLALGMVVAALRRRRSGALAFFTLMTVLAMLVGVVGAAIGTQGRLLLPGQGVAVGSSSQRIVQPIGDTWVSVTPLDAPGPRIELTQWLGNAWISVERDAVLLLDASDAGAIDIVSYDADGMVSRRQIGGLDRGALVIDSTGVRALHPGERADGSVDASLDLTQHNGDVYVQTYE